MGEKVSDFVGNLLQAVLIVLVVMLFSLKTVTVEADLDPRTTAAQAEGDQAPCSNPWRWPSCSGWSSRRS